MPHPDPLPAALEFDLSDEPVTPAPPLPQSARGVGVSTWLQRLKARGGILGSVASIAIVIAKFLGPLKLLLILLVKFPLVVTISTMAASIWLEALRFGWPMAVGIVAMIFIHECGHAWAARRLGRPAKAMIFVPFMGAVVFTKGGGTTVVQDAFVGIMGPVFGTAVGLAYAGLYFATREPVFLQLSSWTFGINLFNLLPTPPLDGGWITPVFSPKLLAFGMVLLIGVSHFNLLVIILAVMSLPRVIAGWKASPQNSAYFQATPRDRALFAALYIGLAVALYLGQHFASIQLDLVAPHQIM